MRTLLTLVMLGLVGFGCGDDSAPADAGIDAADAAADAATDAATDATVDANPVITGLPDERVACSDRDPLRRPFFGDLHVHTAFSFDAAAYDVRNRPADAYRFARGEAVDLPPYDADGNATRTVQLRRPLDFAAVTDHSELLEETTICTDPTSEGYDSSTCLSYRGGDAHVADFGDFISAIGFAMPHKTRMCRANPELCAQQLETVWGETMDAAEAAYDRTDACSFTSFVGYEWTGSAGGGGRNIHRCILFKNRTVSRTPTSFVSANTADTMWNALERDCLDTGTACDLLAIPHNSNISVGQMFVPMTEEEVPYTRAEAERRARLEPLMEIYQHKGSSECITGIPDPLASEDELCEFEEVHENLCTGAATDPSDCTPVCGPTSSGSSFIGPGCVAPHDFARGALREGLSEYARVGADPFMLGFVGSTDTHNGTPGAVREDDWHGHVGNTDDDAVEQLEPPGSVAVSQRTSSPGGLAVIWAEENSRDSLFDALRRRETYATSGTRPVVRVFGGYDYPDDICTRTDLAQVGYDGGVPMGGQLAVAPAGKAPVIVVSAQRDALGAPLQHVQVIKGWFAGGQTHEQIYEVAGDAADGATVDLATCEPTYAGADVLCGRWVDPDFDPSEPAFYYVRVLEDPVCRWSRRACNAAAVDCATATPGSALASCCDGSIPDTIQERAWTSPIFYLP